MFTLSGQIGCNSRETLLTLSWRGPLSYRNQSIDLLGKSMDWFLYDNDFRHEKVSLESEIVIDLDDFSGY